MNPPTENSFLVVGLDYESLRLVLLAVTEDCQEPYLQEHQHFRSVEALQRYLRSPIRDHIQMVSVQGDCQDPLEIKAWLLAQIRICRSGYAAARRHCSRGVGVDRPRFRALTPEKSRGPDSKKAPRGLGANLTRRQLTERA